MPSPQALLALCVLLAINLATFAAFGVDKRRARLRRRRISEATLCWLAFLGGAAGAWMAVNLFRHKTVKTSFRVKLSLATVGCLLWLSAGLWWLMNR
ncbi:MAG: DUF1294 domain-containing protein [Planctomycetes bacterium]|nr:DUF1294 domain-containing protein [Planctomycetota bacterium]